jgi:MSHA biogenesis protein MshJ
MTPLLQTGKKSLDALNRRSLLERSLLSILLTLIIVLVWDSRFYQPTKKHGVAAALQINTLQTTLTGLKSLLYQLQRRKEQDPNTKVQREIYELEKKNSALDDQLAEVGIVLVKAEKLVQIEKTLLEQTGETEFYGVKQLEAKPFKKDKSPSKEKDDTVKLHRHPLTIKWLGSYPDTWSYLKKLESANLPILWDRLQYKTNKAPTGLITLTISTVSIKKLKFPRFFWKKNKRGICHSLSL